jgi:hypothetical protein
MQRLAKPSHISLRPSVQALYGRFGFQRGVMVASWSQLGLPA